MTKPLPVIEIFGPTIQGEGALCGQRSHFVRLGGCPRRCKWCDSMHAVLPEEIKKNAQRLTPQEIVGVLKQIELDNGKARWVTLSGGDPLMWDLEELVTLLRAEKWNIAVETQGDFHPVWLRKVHLLTVSPKPPSAGEPEKTDYDVLDRLAEFIGTTDVVFKVVVFDEADFQFAVNLKKRYSNIRMYLSAGTDLSNAILDEPNFVWEICRQTKWLAERALKEPLFIGAAVLPQMHVLMWPNQKGV